MKRIAVAIGIAGAILLSNSERMAGQQAAASGEVEAYKVRPNFYMLVGAGANIGVQIGSDGVVVVDAGSAADSQKVLAAIKKLTAAPIRYIINTSAEPDHVGGNEALGKAGTGFTNAAIGGDGSPRGGVTIMSRLEVLDRMSAPTGKQASYPVDAWPTETFVTPENAFYLNDEGIKVIHQPAAHSDGDSIVFFRKSDVIMSGDILDTTRFPVIDVEKGGSVQGEIDALNQLVKIAIPSIPLIAKEGGTFIVPGHGYINEQADVVEYRDMMIVIRDVTQDLIKQGKTLDQIKAANPTEAYRPRYGNDSGPWTTDMFVEAVYKSLTAKK